MRFISALFAQLLAATCYGVTLQWDVPTDLSGIGGYEIHHGPSSGTYNQIQAAPGASTATASVPDPATGVRYYAARSVSLDGTAYSAFSNEAVYPTLPDDPADVTLVYVAEDPVVAIRYWVGTDTSWNTSANWSATSGGSGGAGVPTNTDDVIFDGSGTNNCTADVAIDVQSIDVQSGYSGILDFADSTYSHAIGGNATFDGSGTVDCGDATISIDGDFDQADQSTWTRGTSTIVMTTDGSTITHSGSILTALHHLTINGNTSVSVGYMRGTLTVASGKTFTINTRFTAYGTELVNNGDIALTDSTDYIEFRTAPTFTAFGTFSGNGYIRFSSTQTATLPGETYNVGVLARSDGTTLTLNMGGNATFNDYLRLTALSGKTCNLSNSGNYNLTFTDDVDFYYGSAGTVNYTAGTGTITLSSTANQTIDFNGESVEDMVVDKSAGTATLAGAMTTDSLSVDRGTLDIDAQAVDVSGDVTADPVAGAVTVQDTTGGGSISITGNIVMNGTATYAVTWDGVDIDALGAGTNTFSYATISNSNNSSGVAIDCTDNCTDGGGNTGLWTFGAGGTTYTPTIDGQLLTLAGTAGTSRDKVFPVDGQILTLAGAAAKSTEKTFPIDGQLLTLAGAAGHTYAPVVDGQLLTLAGAADAAVERQYNPVVDGQLLTLAGAADISKEYSPTVSGGVALTGSAIVNAEKVYVPGISGQLLTLAGQAAVSTQGIAYTPVVGGQLLSLSGTASVESSSGDWEDVPPASGVWTDVSGASGVWTDI